MSPYVETHDAMRELGTPYMEIQDAMRELRAPYMETGCHERTQVSICRNIAIRELGTPYMETQDAPYMGSQDAMIKLNV